MRLDPWLLFWVASHALSLAAIVVAVARARGVAGTLAWVFAIVAFPVLGALVFLLLANPSIRKISRRKKLTSDEVRRAIAAPAGDRPGAGALEALSATERSILCLAERLTGLPPSSGNRLDLLTDNADAFAAIEGALRTAQRSIWAEYYIISSDETGRRFLEILADRARAGIDVRLLYDALGSASIHRAGVAALAGAGGRAFAFLPLNPLKRRWSVQLRNHRKVIVVDGEVGFTGGMNVGDEYSGGSRRKREPGPWRDTHLELRGPAVHDLAQTFAEDWTFATGERLLPPARPPAIEGATSIVAVVPSGPDQEMNAIGFTYFAGIASATSRCYVTSPYFIPDEPTLRAFRTAALRGVDVRVLVPGRSDVSLLLPAARSYYRSLIQAGVRIFEYGPAMLHAKTMVVDGAWGMVGSANLDIRSFRLNFEVGAVVFDHAFASQLEERYRADLQGSHEVTTRALPRRGSPRHFKESAARLLSPLL